MEDDADDLDNLFDEYESANGPEDENNVEDTAKETETSAPVKVPAPKRAVKNPRLKFNADRLCGERGIPVLVNHFKDVKFRGKGYEKEDLDKLLAALEHWTHRLFPSMKFEDCLHQIEKLGKKRPVQTCVRKIRLDMPVLYNDFVHDEEEEEHNSTQQDSHVEASTEDAFDRLIGDIQRPVTSTPLPSQSSGHTLGSSFGSTLTDEQRKRMEYNKMLAAERRKARLAAAQSCVSVSPNQEDTGMIINLDCDSARDSFNYVAQNSNASVNLSCSKDEVNGPKSSPCSSSAFKSMDVQETMLKESHLLPELKNKNSENLGLDELVDLVDEDESIISDSKLSTADLVNLVDEDGSVTSEVYFKHSSKTAVDEQMDLITEVQTSEIKQSMFVTGESSVHSKGQPINCSDDKFDLKTEVETSKMKQNPLVNKPLSPKLLTEIKSVNTCNNKIDLVTESQTSQLKQNALVANKSCELVAEVQAVNNDCLETEIQACQLKQNLLDVAESFTTLDSASSSQDIEDSSALLFVTKKQLMNTFDDKVYPVTEVQKSDFKRSMESIDSPISSKKCRIMKVGLELNKTVGFVEDKLSLCSQSYALNLNNNQSEFTNEQLVEIENDANLLTTDISPESEVINMPESIFRSTDEENIQYKQKESSNSINVDDEAETADLETLVDLDEKHQKIIGSEQT